MSVWKVRKFREIDELNLFLSGAVMGVDVSYFAQSIQSGGGGTRDLPSLVGLTFITKAPGPAGTCTFVKGASPDGRLTAKEIKSQIEAAIVGLTVRFFEGRLTVVETTPANGVTVDHTGTANSILGFDKSVDTAGKLYASPYVSPPVAPYFGWAYNDNNNMHVIYTFE